MIEACKSVLERQHLAACLKLHGTARERVSQGRTRKASSGYLLTTGRALLKALSDCMLATMLGCLLTDRPDCAIKTPPDSATKTLTGSELMPGCVLNALRK